MVDRDLLCMYSSTPRRPAGGKIQDRCGRSKDPTTPHNLICCTPPLLLSSIQPRHPLAGLLPTNSITFAAIYRRSIIDRRTQRLDALPYCLCDRGCVFPPSALLSSFHPSPCRHQHQSRSYEQDQQHHHHQNQNHHACCSTDGHHLNINIVSSPSPPADPSPAARDTEQATEEDPQQGGGK